jgi:snRNA-activating protein complex subunit 3
MEHLRKMEKKKETLVKKAATPMWEIEFRSLVLRTNQPYWLLHAGNCEHFVVFDQIRHGHGTYCEYIYVAELLPQTKA